jgi:hypothetical protein
MQKTLTATTLIFLTGLMIAISPVNASVDAEQSQSQKGEAECETETVTGAYGQTITRCKVSLEQKQDQQKIVYVEKDAVEKETLVHKPVDTALDTKSITTAVGTIVSGAGAFVIKLKKKISK